MRSAARTAACIALLAVCAAGAWAQEPAKAPKAQQPKPEIKQDLKALRVGRLELMKERIELQLLRERGAPAKDLEAREKRIKALGEKQHKQMVALREKHPQLARRMRAAGKMRLGQGMAGQRGAMRGLRGPMERGMARGARMHQFGPKARMGARGMGQGCPQMGMGKRGMGPQGRGMAWGPQGRSMMGRQHMGMKMQAQSPRGAWGQQGRPMGRGMQSGRGGVCPHCNAPLQQPPSPAEEPAK